MKTTNETSSPASIYGRYAVSKHLYSSIAAGKAFSRGLACQGDA